MMLRSPDKREYEFKIILRVLDACCVQPFVAI
jgi:hypothetical protein